MALLITIWYVWQNGLLLNKQKSHVLFTPGSLETANREQISRNREYLKILIDIALYLSRQGLAFRGHDEKELSTNQGIHT